MPTKSELVIVSPGRDLALVAAPSFAWDSHVGCSGEGSQRGVTVPKAEQRAVLGYVLHRETRTVGLGMGMMLTWS